jgi:hypothetical protein
MHYTINLVLKDSLHSCQDQHQDVYAEGGEEFIKKIGKPPKDYLRFSNLSNKFLASFSVNVLMLVLT